MSEQTEYDEYFFGKVAAHAYVDEMQKLGVGTVGRTLRGAALGSLFGGPLVGGLLGGYLGYRSGKKKEEEEKERLKKLQQASAFGAQMALSKRPSF